MSFFFLSNLKRAKECQSSVLQDREDHSPKGAQVSHRNSFSSPAECLQLKPIIWEYGIHCLASTLPSLWTMIPIYKDCEGFDEYQFLPRCGPGPPQEKFSGWFNDFGKHSFETPFPTRVSILNPVFICLILTVPQGIPPQYPLYSLDSVGICCRLVPFSTLWAWQVQMQVGGHLVSLWFESVIMASSAHRIGSVC